MLKGKADKGEYWEECWGNNIGYIKLLKKHKCQEKHGFK